MTPTKLRRIGNKMYNRVPSIRMFGCLGCDFRLDHGNCELDGVVGGSMCREDGRYFNYHRAHTFKY